MKKTLLFMLMLVILTGFRVMASRTISGTVYDEKKYPLIGVTIYIDGTSSGTTTDSRGHYSIVIPEGKIKLAFSYIGFKRQIVEVGKNDTLNIVLKNDDAALNEVVVIGYGTSNYKSATNADIPELLKKMQGINVDAKGNVTINNQSVNKAKINGKDFVGGNVAQAVQNLPSDILERIDARYLASVPVSDESYNQIIENKFEDPTTTPLSTFSADVDAASYSNVRRFINAGQLPPKNAVRIEEMVNYFQYNLPEPTSGAPVAIHTELATAPWNSQHQLVRIGLKAKNVKLDKLPASNLVFLLDVSGSMNEPNKLPLVKSSLKMLVDQLRPIDHVAIVVYAGAAGLILPSTPGDEKVKIKDAIDNLSAGGSTAGGAGITLAYKIARENFIKEGNNRIIWATDGDFNVGASSDNDMESLIEGERKSGVSISILGFGMGNLKDSKMERMADKGHGNYAYIDNITEATKSMVSEFGGTLFTVAKDVKIQVEFNPAKVQAYRLLGYEDRLLAKEDFNDDSKLGGDMGVGHTVTALYEIIPVGVKDSFTTSVDPLKYQKPVEAKTENNSSDIMTVKFRYKDPQSEVSKMEQVTVTGKAIDADKTSDDFKFAAAVVEYGLLLRDSQFKQNARFDQLISIAKSAKGKDDDGYRAEFIRLAESTKNLMKTNVIADIK
ncbi:MAG: von Willebrand factor type A domain-containing protein [Mucilaginibacter sp.]